MIYLKCYKSLLSKDTNIVFKKDRYNHITTESVDKSNFTILSGNKTVNKMLGYEKETYKDQSSYRSDYKHNVKSTDKIYLFIDNISLEDKPFAVLDLNKDQTDMNLYKVTFTDSPIQLSDFNIQFRTDSSKSSDLYNFGGQPHELFFKVGIIS